MGTYWQGLLLQPDCHLCPLRHDRKVLPDGPVPTKLCFVGEGPGVNEVEEGRGFMGKSGDVLWTLGGSYGVKREDVWVTNAALCRPRDVRLSTGVVLKIEQVKALSVRACRKRLIYELLYVTNGDPTAVVVPIGKLALNALGTRKNMGIFQYRGSIQDIDLRALWQQVSQTRVGW